MLSTRTRCGSRAARRAFGVAAQHAACHFELAGRRRAGPKKFTRRELCTCIAVPPTHPGVISLWLSAYRWVDLHASVRCRCGINPPLLLLFMMLTDSHMLGDILDMHAYAGMRDRIHTR